MEKVLRFEKVGDVTQRYSFLELFVGDEIDAIMIVTISEEQVLHYRTYAGNLSFTGAQWAYIKETAEKFFLEELENEESFNNFMNDIPE